MLVIYIIPIGENTKNSNTETFIYEIMSSYYEYANKQVTHDDL